MQTWSAYYNGEWRAADGLSVSIDDLGFLLGATVVERLRTFGGRVFRLQQHLQRMYHSLEIVGLDAGTICHELMSVVPECVERNRSLIHTDDDLSVAAFATPGTEHRDEPTICVHSLPLPFINWVELHRSGVAVVVSDVRQVPACCWPPELKCRSRIHYFLADQQARRKAPGARAVLLDQDGYVGETTNANVLVYRRGEGLISPPRDRILPGVTLAATEEIALQEGIPFAEKLFPAEDLQTGDEVLLVGTSICVLPVVSCDGRSIGSGTPGPVYHRLLAAWNRLAGLDLEKQARQFAVR